MTFHWITTYEEYAKALHAVSYRYGSPYSILTFELAEHVCNSIPEAHCSITYTYRNDNVIYNIHGETEHRRFDITIAATSIILNMNVVNGKAWIADTIDVYRERYRTWWSVTNTIRKELNKWR